MITPPPTPVPSVSSTRFSAPLPAPSLHSASAATFASFSTATGMPKRSPSRSCSEKSVSGMLIEPSARPVRRSSTDGIPRPIAPTPVPASGSIAAAIASSSSSCELVGVGTS